jgi:triacylglycerol lipase
MRDAVAIGRELLAIARQGRLIAGARRRAAHDLVEPSGDRAVLFVHGYMAAGPVFGPMREHLERSIAGTATFDLGYGPLEPFDHAAARVARAIDRLARDRPVDLVCHSLGGILARWAIQELGAADGVGRLVTLATPHAGTRTASMMIGSLAAAIRPRSAVIERLRQGRARAAAVGHTAIVAGADRMITPPASAAAIDDATVHWLDDVGHNEILFAPEAHALVASALAG